MEFEPEALQRMAIESGQKKGSDVLFPISKEKGNDTSGPFFHLAGGVAAAGMMLPGSGQLPS